jgi:hypothetical protein
VLRPVEPVRVDRMLWDPVRAEGRLAEPRVGGVEPAVRGGGAAGECGTAGVAIAAATGRGAMPQWSQ